jgi:5-formaminoimidazole-4-carboxamide-1-(beta)-D-ribofuranosyl 5'-monophosphate synthetase
LSAWRYNWEKLTLGCVGSHSALEVAAGARAQGLRNLVITATGRDQTYMRHFKRVEGEYARGCVDETLSVGAFTEMLEPRIQEAMLERNVIFVPNRSFEVYLHQKYSYDEIERGMQVPFFGNRRLLRAEERDEPNNQYAMMDRAGIRYPRRLGKASEIDTLVMVKAPHKKVSFERAFFLVRSPSEYEREAQRLIAAGILDERGLQGAVIEEYLLGPTVNLNFFYSPMLGELELMGTDTRRQTNLDGLRALPHAQGLGLADVQVSMEEAGHIAATLTESMLEQAFELGERLVRAAQAIDPPGILGPFALQCAIVSGPPKAFVVYDVSLRIPGSPGTRYTPYSSYRWGRDVSVGERIAMEIVMARKAGRLEALLT